MALSPEQLAMLKKMPGINQNLVSAYEKGGTNLTSVEKDAIKKSDTSEERLAEIASQSFVTPENKQAIQKQFPTQTVTAAPTQTTKRETPQINVPTKDKVSSMQSFSSALQQAVNLGRAQRQSAELDFMGGVIPPGSVSANQFTGLLANLNRASTKFTEPLVNAAVGFAQDEQENIRDEQNSIRDLALAAVEAGGSQESVNAILAAGTIDSAISVAAGTLNTGSKMVIEKVGSNLVQYDPKDPEGTTKVLFSASTGGGSGGSSTRDSSEEEGSSVTFERPSSYLEMTSNELLVETKKTFAPDFANKVASDLTNEQLKLFLSDYAFETQNTRTSVTPEIFYEKWRVGAGLDKESTSESTSGTSNPFRT